MAIKVNVSNSKYGVPFNGAYFRIVSAQVSRTRNPLSRFTVTIDVAGYASEPINDEIAEVDFRRYHVPYSEVAAITGEDIFVKCYSWLMLQDDMAGSVGV
jgi:hypothetical protein